MVQVVVVVEGDIRFCKVGRGYEGGGGGYRCNGGGCGDAYLR